LDLVGPRRRCLYMKAKKLLLLSAFVLLLVALVLGVTGLSVAAPATAVKGTCELTDYFFNWEGMVVDPVSGDWVMEDNWVEYQLHGDLEGFYREDVTYYGNMKSRVHWSEGQATFAGMLGSELVSWTARLYGVTWMDPAYEFAGKCQYKDTLTSGMKGQITFHMRFDYEDGRDYRVYTGELK